MSPSHRPHSSFRVLLLGWLFLGALPPFTLASPPGAQETSELPTSPFGEPPPVPTGPLPPEILRAIETAFGASLAQGLWGPEQAAAVAEIGAANDPRLAWILSDFMRVSTAYEERAPLAGAGGGAL
ncbi:MAG: hypothetical protein AAF368_05495, partial [Planctomycetota bacterium]